MTINKGEFIAYITKSNDLFTNKIIEIIKDDAYWLGELGIQEADIKIDKSISEIIKTKLSDPENKEAIDMVLKHVIGNHLLDYDDENDDSNDDEIPIVKIEYRDLAFKSVNAFYVFKCKHLYFCYYFLGLNYKDLELKTLITKNALNFCQNVMTEIYKERKNLGSCIDMGVISDEDTYEQLLEQGEVYLNEKWNFNWNI